MDTRVDAALITGLFAVIVSLIAVGRSYFDRVELRRSARRTTEVARGAEQRAHSAQLEVEAIRSELRTQRAELDARRDYEYEAKKRLYSELGPLLFQLTELADGASSQIARLSEPGQWKRLTISSSRAQELQRSGWIGTANYDAIFAVYTLLAPLASHQFIQRRLTLVDLALDRRVRLQWLLLRAIYESFSKDEAMAALAPSILYTPRTDGWRRLRVAEPTQFWWQGVSRGRLDNAVELIVADQTHSIVRLRTYGEFEAIYLDAYKTGNGDEKTLGAFGNPIFDFAPARHPVYWRLLAVQWLLYRALVRLGTESGDPPTSEDVVSWLAVDSEFDDIFNVGEAESIAALQAVVNRYLMTYVLPTLPAA